MDAQLNIGRGSSGYGEILKRLKRRPC